MVADFMVEPVERAEQVRGQVRAMRADLLALWEKVPAVFRPAVQGKADAVFSRLETLEKLTGGR